MPKLTHSVTDRPTEHEISLTTEWMSMKLGTQFLLRS